MAINYNLAKVHELSDNDPEFVMQIITLLLLKFPRYATNRFGNKNERP
jgi:hypothetical protein